MTVPRDPKSRTRRGRRPDPDVKALRALRRATDDYLLVLSAGLKALTDDAVAGKPTLAYIRSRLAVATWARPGLATASLPPSASAHAQPGAGREEETT